MFNISIYNILINSDPFFSESSGLSKDMVSTVKVIFLDESAIRESKQGLVDNPKFPAFSVDGQ